MKLFRTVVFVLLFCAVAAIYLFQTRLTKQALTITPDEVNRTVSISKNDPVTRVELRDSVQKTKIVLQKENGMWELEEPVRYPAEGQIVEGLVAAARMASQQPRLRAEKEWGEYGLVDPEFITVFDLQGKGVKTLLIGAQAPVGKAVFAKWAEERGFFLLPAEMKGVFRQSVYGLRQKRLFRAPPDTIRKIYVEMGQRSYQWKKEHGEWYWLEPVEKLGQKVPKESMALALEGLQNLYVREFLDHNKKSKAELGFFMIHDYIWIECGDSSSLKQGEAGSSLPEGKKEALYFGNEVPEKNAYYGFLEGEDVVFWVDRAKVIEFFDLLRKLLAEGPKLETKDLRSDLVDPKQKT